MWRDQRWSKGVKRGKCKAHLPQLKGKPKDLQRFFFQRHLLSMLLVSVQLYNPIKHVLVCYSSSSMIRMPNQTAMFLYHQIRPRYRHYPWGITVLPAIYLTRWGTEGGIMEGENGCLQNLVLHCITFKYCIVHLQFLEDWSFYHIHHCFWRRSSSWWKHVLVRIIAWFLPLEH